MSNTEEMEKFLGDALFPGKPRSPSEAAAQQEPDPEKAAPRPDQVELPGDPVQPAPPEDAPVVVTDEPPKPPAEPFPETPLEPHVEEAPGEEEEPPEDELEDENVVWAKKKYGDDAHKWAKAARDQELYISRLANEKREAEELAGQWYEYAQQAEAQQAQLGGALPLSAQEEQWVEAALANPLEFARQAAFSGKTQLFNGIVERLAEDNPMLAANVATQVQTELQQYAAYEASQQQPPQVNLAQSLGASFQRLGIDLQTEGPRMAEKIAELGEYNPYVQAIMHGDDGQRDLAVQAVHDLTRATYTNTRRATRDEAIQRENELRRDAMVVQSGGIQAPTPPPPKPAFLQGMEDEWRRRGQYADEE